MYALRKAELTDASAMAYVHAISWQTTYKNLLDDCVINKFNVENREKMWVEFLNKETHSQKAYVAINEDKIIGIASWNETTDCLELLTLYILSEFQGQGIGRALFQQVEKDAVAKKKRLITWVLQGNKATFFYEKMGLKLLKSEERRLGNISVQELMLTN